MQIEKGRKKGIPKIKPIISSKGLKKKKDLIPPYFRSTVNHNLAVQVVSVS